GKQWVSVGKYDLLDMPGVLWKKFEDRTVATNLAFIGSIKDDILDIEEIATDLLSELQHLLPNALMERYKLTCEELNLDSYELLQCIGAKRGMLISGGDVNTERAAIMVVDEFRGNKIGRITLESPCENI
ncbi:MAG: ribosome biogenesis GTPase YlqF, partial [Oscillospiraceae bacterium]